MKIALINNLYGDYARGGAEGVVKEIALGLSGSGHGVVVISIKSFLKTITIGDNNFREYYLPGVYFYLNKIPLFFRFIWHLWDMFNFLRAIRIIYILKKEKCDLVITHNLKGVSYFLPLFLKIARIKHFHTLHDVQLFYPSGLMLLGEEMRSDYFLARVYQFFCRILFSSPEAVISPSSWLMQEHIKRGFFKNSKKIILPNPISLDVLYNKKEKQDDMFSFFYAGQVERHKGIVELVEAFRLIKNNNAELLVVGDGSIMDEIRKIAQGDERVKILGRKKREETRKLMADSDLVIMPSVCYENSPTVIYEAFSAGIPAIASDLGGASEIFIGNNHFLFKAGNKDDLFNKMNWALNNKEEVKFFGKKMKQEVQKLNINNYLERIKELNEG